MVIGLRLSLKSSSSERDHDLAEVLVGVHMRERVADVLETVDAIDWQLQLACLDRAPDVLADLLEDPAYLVDGAGAEGDADVGDAACRMQVEIEVGVGAAEPADIDDAALDLGGLQVLVGDRTGHLVDDEVDALAVSGLEHLINPVRIRGLDCEVGAVII